MSLGMSRKHTGPITHAHSMWHLIILLKESSSERVCDLSLKCSVTYLRGALSGACDMALQALNTTFKDMTSIKSTGTQLNVESIYTQEFEKSSSFHTVSVVACCTDTNRCTKLSRLRVRGVYVDHLQRNISNITNSNRHNFFQIHLFWELLQMSVEDDLISLQSYLADTQNSSQPTECRASVIHTFSSFHK